MPSRLTGLVYAVKWSDFQGQVPAGATHTAHIDTRMNLQFGWRQRQGQVSLADNVVMTVLIRRQQSWAKTTGRTASLLAHEQRHYDITALMARDLFIDVMALKGQSFPNRAALQSAIDALSATYDPQPVQERYDHETTHSQNTTAQARWDCMIQRAFTVPRSPVRHAPDGAVYKIRLNTALADTAAACVAAP